MKKRSISLLLATVVALGCLAGCGNTGETSKESESTPVASESKQESQQESQASSEPEEKPLYNVGELPIVNEPITLKVLTQDPTNTPYSIAEESGIWAFLEEKTGIKFEVESYSNEELKSVLPLIMSTPDEMPDLFFRCEMTAADVLQYGQNGQLLMMDDYIEEYCPNIKEMFETLDYGRGASTSADGHIYAMPSMNASVATCRYSFNSEFLKRAGVEAPKTLEELYDVFKAIQACDANGDGIVGNEICWTNGQSGFKRGALSMVGLCCYWPWQGCIFDDKDGEVFFVPTSEEYKYLLGWLNKFYEEGMIDQELFTHTYAEAVEKIESGIVFMHELTDDPESKSYKGRVGEYIPVPLTSAVHDDPFITIGAPYQTDIGSVAANTEYPEICMMLIDYLFSEEGSRAAFWGLEGVDYTVKTEDPWVVESTSTEYGLGYTQTPLLVPRWNRDEWVQPAKTELGRASSATYKEYGKMGWQNYIHFTDEESEIVNTYSTDLGLYTDDYFVGFITGTYDIEKDWDAYVETVNSMKVDELVEVYQAAYDRFYQ